MRSLSGEGFAAAMLAAAVQMFAAATSVVAQPADGVVATVEVTDKIRAARGPNPGNFGGDVNAAAPLLQLTDFPTLAIDVDPADVKDFVVAINGIAYQAGARMFRVVVGPATITITRRGKEACTAKLDVTAAGPNAVACRM